MFSAGMTKSECICKEFMVEPTTPDNGSSEKTFRIVSREWKLRSVQSPIELRHEESDEYDNFPPLEFHGHWDNVGEAILHNNGYTANLTFENRDMPRLLGGPLHDDEYIFEQLHFHWSDDNDGGCEHIFEGKAYSMEAHAVHYNKQYNSFKEAVDKHDGLAVVAFFLHANTDVDNAEFKKLSDGVKEIPKIQSKANVAADCLSWIKDSAQCKGYYAYSGSLTTKPYNESVTWIIYPRPISISQEQVDTFRNMKSTPCETHNIVKNIRPIQVPSRKLNIIYARSHSKEI